MGIVKRCVRLRVVELAECRNVDENVFKLLRQVEGLQSLGLRTFRQSFGNAVMLR